MTQTNCEVLVVGAGAGGLTVALACANAGQPVLVVERRLNPFSDKGAELLAQSDRLLAKANDARDNNQNATDLLLAVGQFRAQVWGTRQRTIILDTLSLAYLNQLGVDVANFPLVEKMDIDWGPTAPKLCVRYATQDRDLGNIEAGRLSHQRTILQRDWAVQTSIGDLEDALLEAARTNPLINIRFGAEASSCAETTDGVQVHVGAEEAVYGLLVIADGGGNGSLIKHLGITRTALLQESLDVVVFATGSSHQEPNVYGQGFVSSGGWTGIGSTGGLLTVDVRGTPGVSTQSADTIARNKGIQAPLAEPPMCGTFDIDHASQLVHGSRVVLIGDAAVRGSPLFALGIGQTMLWSQTVADLVTHVGTTKAPQALKDYEQTADTLVRSRLTFETACLHVLDQSNAQERSFAQALASPALLRGITIDELEFATGHKGAYIAVCVHADFKKLSRDTPNPGPEVLALEGLGRVELRVRARFQLRKGAAVAHLTPDQELIFSSGVESMRVSGGQIRIDRIKDCWSMRIENAVVTRNTLTNDKFETPISEFGLNFPDAFLDDILSGLSANLEHIRPRRNAKLELNLEDRSELQWGPVSLRFHQRAQIWLSLIEQGKVTRLRLKLAKGYVEPVAFAKFLEDVPLVATRCVVPSPAKPSRLSSIINTARHSVLDSWARLAGSSVSQLDIDFHPDGGGSITFYLRVSQLRFTAALSATDVATIQSELFRSQHLANFFQTSRSPLHAARVHL